MASTLGTLVQNCLVDLSDPNQKFFTATELKKAIGDAYKYYYQWCTDDGEGYFTAYPPTILGFTALDPAIDISGLTPALFNVARLERNTSNGTIPLQKNERRFRPNFTVNTGTGDSYQPTWRLQSQNIILEPPPQGTEVSSATTGVVLSYNYLPDFPVAATADAFEFDSVFPIIWEPMVCVRADIIALESKDAIGGVSDISSFRERLKEYETAFEDSIERSEYPDSVQYSGNTYSNNYNWR